jgi:hypothetical protein
MQFSEVVDIYTLVLALPLRVRMLKRKQEMLLEYAGKYPRHNASSRVPPPHAVLPLQTGLEQQHENQNSIFQPEWPASLLPSFLPCH